MTQANTDFGRVADDLRRAATSFALLTSSASLLGASLKEFREFEKQLVLTNAIAGGTVAQFEAMKNAARSFSLVTTTSALDAGAALQQLAQAGFTAQESLQGMAGVLLLAQATLTDVRVTADVLSSNIRAFGLATSDTTRVANVFTAAITGSLATMDKLAFAMRQVAPVAELAGLSIEETSAALGVLFNIGLRGEQAGTALRNIIIRLVRPLGEAGDLLRGAGIATRDATGEFRNLAEILTDIGNSNLGDAELARIFETEALAGAKAFINALQAVGDTGKNAYEELRDGITGTNRAIEIAAANLDTFDGAMGLFRNTISDVAKDLGEALAPTIISFTEFIREMVANFKALEPSQQLFRLQVVKWTAALVGGLSVLSAITILLRGLGIGSLVSYSTGMLAAAASTGTFGGSLAATTAVMQTFLIRTGAAAIGLKSFSASTAVGASLATRLTISMLGVQASMVATAASLKGLSLGALMVTPFGLAATGAIALTAGVYGVVKAFDALSFTSAELQDALVPIDNLENRLERANAREIADLLIGEGTAEEVRNRVDKIRNEMILAEGTLQGSDLSQFFGVGVESAKGNANASADAIKALDAQFAGVFEYLQAERAVEAAIAQAEEQGGEFSDFISRQLAFRSARAALLEKFEDLPNEAQVQIDELRGTFGELTAANQQSAELVKDYLAGESKATEAFLTALTTDGAEVAIPENLQPALIAIRSEEFLAAISGEAALKDLAEQIASADGAESIETIFREAFKAAGYDATRIEDIIITEIEVQSNALSDALNSLQLDLEVDIESLRIELLEQELALATSVGEAGRLASEIGLAKLVEDLNKLGADNRDALEKVIVDFGIDNREGQTEAIQAALDATDVDFDAAATSFAELLSGQAFLDAVTSRIDADTTTEEAAAIAQEEAEKFEKIAEIYIETLGEAGTVTPEQLDDLRAIFSANARLSAQAAVAGLGETDAAIADAIEDVEREAKRVARLLERQRKDAQRAFDDAERDRQQLADDRETAAKDALSSAREVEDLFRQAGDATRDAEEAYFEAIRGVGVGFREQFLFDLEVDNIAADAERQIASLQRQLQDIQSDFKGSPEQLNELVGQYDLLIDQIERTRDAEIASADSFSAQMDRRSAAIDLFIRDLQDVAFESDNTFTKVGAGIASAFAEFNRDIVTLVDITKDATLGFIDATSNAFSDFIFDGENAFENFKNSLLDISKQVVAGFAKAFLQQTISSITGGEGSIFGNAQQPSRFGDSGTPSVGTGGIFGKLFPGLAGGMSENEDPMRSDTTALQSALDQAGTDTDKAHQEFLDGQRNTWGMFTNDLQLVLDQTLAEINGLVGAGGGGSASTNSFAGVGASSPNSPVNNNYTPTGDAFFDGLATTADALGVSMRDLATVISYETAGSFDPRQRGPTTKHGQHRGLIQFGEPQAARNGVDFSTEQSAIETQFGANGAIVQYLKRNGFEEGMGILDLYSTINAGAPGLYSRSDANNGGTPGNVADKVGRFEEEGHYAAADRLLAGMNQAVPQLEQAAASISAGAGDIEMAGGQLNDTLVNPPMPANGGATGITAPTIASADGMLAEGASLEEVMQQMLTQTADTFEQFNTGLADVLNQVLQSIAQMGDGISAPSISAGGSGGGGFGGLGSLFGGGSGGGSGSTGSLGLGSLGGLNTSQGVGGLQSLFGFASQFFDTGGYTGNGAKMDPAGIVHKGEFVFDAEMTKKYLPLFEALHSGKTVDGYSNGGSVGFNSFGDNRMFANNGSFLNKVDDTSSQTTAQQRAGDSITMNVSYQMKGDGGSSDRSFRRSASQHAKRMAQQIEKAKRNT